MIKNFIISIALCLTLMFSGCATTGQPVFDQDTIDHIIDIISDINKPKPQPTPVPTPVPVPDPTPAPIPPPVPITMDVVLFDLNMVGVEMSALGIPERQEAQRYALGQIANGWDIPNQSAELNAMIQFRPQIEKYYEDKITKMQKFLNDNPSARLTIITNDQVDTGFGCRIGPPTFERFLVFGARVQMGTIVPESEYH
jgi:hypothetical protein